MLLLWCLSTSCAYTYPLKIFVDRCPKASDVIVVVDACTSDQADFYTQLGSGTCRDKKHANEIITAYREAGGVSKVWLISYYYEETTVQDPFAKAVKMARECSIPFVNISGGGYEYSLKEFIEIKKYTDEGGMVFAAAGNNNTDEAFYPASLPFDNVIGVGALTCHGNTKATYSNFGIYVDSWEKGCYNGRQGTSYATPRALARWQKEKKVHKMPLWDEL